MKRSSAFVPALVLAASAVSGQTQTQTVVVQARTDGQRSVFTMSGQPPAVPMRDNTPMKTGTAKIRGRVVAGDTGQPLRKAQVRIFSPEIRENRLATTDVEGAYEFKDLPAGRYTLTATKGSYVNLQYGQTRPNEPGKPLEVRDAQTVEKVDFALPRGGIILGRVVDEFGEPVTDVQVMPMRQQYIQGRRRMTPAGRLAQTNDIGEFRIFGLPPGHYYISATLRNFNGMDSSSDDRSGYAATYYPGTASVAEAQKVTVGLGEAVNEINIPLMATRIARVSGTAFNRQGTPLSAGTVMVMQQSAVGAMGMSGGGQVKADGTFVVNGLAPGDYTLRAMPMRNSGPQTEFAMGTVSVNGVDVTGVQLSVATMITGTGRIVVSDPAAAQTLKPAGFRVMATPVNPDDAFMMMSGPGGGEVKDDFSFEIKTMPGKFNLRFSPAMGPPPATGGGWLLKAVRLNGVDVTDTGVDFTSGGDVGGIELELTNKPQEVSGLVINSKGESVKNYSAIVFAQDRERWTGNSRYQGIGRPDQNGRFQVRSLPPGKYYIVAVEYVDSGESGDPEFLERMSTKATAFSLNEGETKVLDLKLQTGS